MSAVRQVAESESERHSGGFVFYPRHYVVNSDDPFRSYAQGVKADGSPVTVLVRPPDDAIASWQQDKSKVLPNFDLFSRTGRRARVPCEATPDNCRQKPAGILLIEQAQPLEHKPNIWIGKWASVLRNTSEDPRPAIGTGYLEISMDPDQNRIGEIRQMIGDYQQLMAAKTGGRIAPIDAEQRMSELLPRIYAAHRHWFAAVMLLGVQVVPELTLSALREACRAYLEKPVPQGMYRGLMVRVRSGDRVFRNAVFDVNMQYDYKNRRVQTFDEIFSPFARYQFPKLTAAYSGVPDPVLEIVPTLRILFGPKGKELYTKHLTDWSRGKPKILKAYVDSNYHGEFNLLFRRNHAFLASRVAVRVFEIQSGTSRGNLIASAIHSFSPTIGPAAAIAPNRHGCHVLAN